MFDENEIKKMVEKWSDFNSEIDEEDEFDVDCFYELYKPTVEIVREC